MLRLQQIGVCPGTSNCCGFAGMRHRELIANPPLAEGTGFDKLIVKYGNGDYKDKSMLPVWPPAQGRVFILRPQSAEPR